MKFTCTILTAALALAGCAPSLEIPVKRKWTKSIRNYALVPIYPMRENVYIGTLRLVRKEDDLYTLGSRSLGYVDVSQALLASEREQPAYGKSGKAQPITEGSKLVGISWNQPNSNLFPQGGAPNRLRMAALPGISLVRLSEADFTRGGLLGLLNYAIGGSFRRQAHLDITLTGIETLELDDVRATQILQREVLDEIRRDPKLTQGICAAASSLGQDIDGVQLSMITRVFYARGIQYSYGKKSSAALKAAAGQGGVPSSDNIFAPSGTDAGAAVDGTTPAETQQNASVSLEGVTPGTVSKVAVQSEDGLTQNEVFERPMAFGAQALSVNGEDLGLKCVRVASKLQPIVAAAVTTQTSRTAAAAPSYQATLTNQRSPAVVSPSVGTPFSPPAYCNDYEKENWPEIEGCTE